jgi:hypothetical protein
MVVPPFWLVFEALWYVSIWLLRLAVFAIAAVIIAAAWVAVFFYALIAAAVQSVKSYRGSEATVALPRRAQMRQRPHVRLEVPRLGPSGTYDATTCATYVSAQGDSVLENAFRFFGILHLRGEVNSVQLAQLLGVAGPRAIPGALTTPLKRRVGEEIAAPVSLERRESRGPNRMDRARRLE